MIQQKKWLIVIPARLHSTRLPLKMTLDLCGKPLVVRVYENLKFLEAEGFSIIVATDSKEIVQVCDIFNVPSFLSQEVHKSGTDRCYEVARVLNYPYIINVQGDEPFFYGRELLKIIQKKDLLDKGSILTFALRSFNPSDRKDLSVVKLVAHGSKAKNFLRDNTQDPSPFFYHHQGVYAYHIDTLAKFCSYSQSTLEKALGLEQMRALENGVEIYFIETKHSSLGIDTKEDLIKARDIFSLREG